MLIEGTSSSPRIPLSVCLKSRHNNEKITRALTGRKIWLRSAVQNKDENRAGGRVGDRGKGKGRFYGGDEIWKKRKR